MSSIEIERLEDWQIRGRARIERTGGPERTVTDQPTDEIEHRYVGFKNPQENP